MNVIQSIVTLIYAIILICTLLDFKLRYKNKLFLWFFITAFLIFDAIALINLGYFQFMKLYPLLVQVPLYISFLFLSDYKPIKLLFVNLTIFVIICLPVLTTCVILSFLTYNALSYDIICWSLYIIMWFNVNKYLRPSFVYMLNNADKGWSGFCLVPLSYIILIYYIGKYGLISLTSVYYLNLCLLCLISILTAYFIILRCFKQTNELVTIHNEQNLLEMQVTASQLHLQSLKESQEKTIIWRHDMRHHLALVNAYLTGNNNEAAKNHIAEVNKSIEDIAIEKYCSNYSVNLILCSYISLAKKEEIAVETKIKLSDKNVVSDIDLCIIFANAIENAVNACRGIPIKNRTLKITCQTKTDNLLIQISNSYEGTVVFHKDMPISTKENHGIGTKSIAAIANKYGGQYSFTAKDGIFITNIIL